MAMMSRLLATVSVAALIVAATPSLAEGIRAKITGGLAFGPNVPAEQVVDGVLEGPPDTSTINDYFGGYGALELGFGIMPLVDLTARVGVTHVTGSAEYEDFSSIDPFLDKFGDIENSLDLQTLDLEVGHAPEIDDNFDLRLAAGLRGMHYNVSLTNTVDKVGGTDVFSQTDEFWGVGPRASVEFAKRMGDSPFGISGGIGAGVIVGNLHRTTDDDGDVDESDGIHAVLDVEAQIGLDVHAGENAKFTAGYRAELITDINDINGTGPEHQIIHGPFVSAGGSF